jgi:hypothetical protein
MGGDKLSLIHTAILFLAPATVFVVLNMPQQAEFAFLVGGAAVVTLAAWKYKASKKVSSS